MGKYPLPTPKQVDWADRELGVIIHHCMDVYHPDIPLGRVKSFAKEMPAESFAPTDEDTDQWLAAAAEMGAKYAVFVANHMTGFSMWPTKENSYSIASSPYRNGKADVVRDFIGSCKKYGVKPGLYYSTGTNGFYGIDGNREKNYRSERYQKYVRTVERQLGEIWGNYGDLYELWFDGGIVPKELGGPDILGLIRRYQPDAICFQGPAGHGQNLRWVGNERGRAPLDCWATSHHDTCGFGGTEEDDEIGAGNPDGEYWIPAETDMGNRKQSSFGGGWMWAANQENLVYSPEELFNRYLTSVGRNSNLLLGMCISRRGHFEDAEQFAGLGKLVRDLYRSPAASCRGTGNSFELSLGQPEHIRYLVVGEDIRYGERVRDFSVDLETENGTERFFQAHCIGHKRIIPIGRNVKRALLTVREAVDRPVIREMTLYR